jgi:gamma-glutamyltranspeptidase
MAPAASLAFSIIRAPTPPLGHHSASDRAGNVLAYTFTINSTGGNGVMVQGAVPAQQRAD